MSTEICRFKTSDYHEGVSLTRFSGGEKGAKVQLTVDGFGYKNEPVIAYVRLSRADALKLARKLIDSFNYELHPSE